MQISDETIAEVARVAASSHRWRPVWIAGRPKVVPCAWYETFEDQMTDDSFASAEDCAAWLWQEHRRPQNRRWDMRDVPSGE